MAQPQKTLAERIKQARTDIINAMQDGRIEHAKAFQKKIAIVLGREIKKLGDDPRATIYKKIQYELKMLLLDDYKRFVVPVDNEYPDEEKAPVNVKEEIVAELGDTEEEPEELEEEEIVTTNLQIEEYCDYKDLLGNINEEKGGILLPQEVADEINECFDDEGEPIEEEIQEVEERHPEIDILDKLKDLLKEYEE